MERVLIATQAWGVPQDPEGTILPGHPFELTTPTGGPVTRYLGPTDPAPEPSAVLGAGGEVPGYVDVGTYLLEVDGVSRQVEAVSGGLTSALDTRLADVEGQLPESVVITGVPAVGEVLTGSGDPETHSFQWTLDGVAIPGATTENYVVAPTDLGHEIGLERIPKSAGVLIPGVDFSAWAHHRDLTVDKTKVSGVQIDFTIDVDAVAAGIAAGAREDLADIRVLDVAANAVVPHEVESAGGGLLTNNGGWTWPTGPYRVIACHGAKNCVYAALIATPTGDAIVQQVNLATNVITGFTLHAAWDLDDHSVPGLAELPDHKLMAFYSRSTSAGRIAFRKQTTAEDNSAWTAEQNITVTDATKNITYPKPMYLSGMGTGAGRMWVLWRHNGKEQGYTFADDPSAATPTWSAQRTLVSNPDEPNLAPGGTPGQRPYVFPLSNGVDRIDLFFHWGHPRETDDMTLNHCYLKWEGGVVNVRNSAGVLISDLAALDAALGITKAAHAAAVTKVFDQATTGGKKVWVHDMEYDTVDGSPIVVFARFVSDTQHEYWRAKWMPATNTWHSSKICDAGGSIAHWFTLATPDNYITPHYSGGIAIVKSNTNAVHVAVQSTGYDHWEMQRRETPDDGDTWPITNRITPGSRKVVTRPVSPFNSKALTVAGPEIIFMQGSYIHWQAYSTRLVMWPPRAGQTPEKNIRMKVSIDDQADKVLRVFYGKPDAESAAVVNNPAPPAGGAAGAVYDATTIIANPRPDRAFGGNSWGHLDAFSLRSRPAVSMSCFIAPNTNDGSRDYIVSNWETSGRPACIVYVLAGKLWVQLRISEDTVFGGEFVSTAIPYDGVFRSLIWTYDSNTLKAYLGNAQMGTTFAAVNKPMDASNGGQPGMIGGSYHEDMQTVRKLKATGIGVKRLRFHNRVLDQAFVTTHANLESLVTVGAEV